jgi:UDP-N-acetylglucosamine--N-acetylmuramyl-(pentapeptide) pyrophosphoryl-undecaprenol N-acetylglucosamine transferase
VPVIVTGNPARPTFERLYRQTHGDPHGTPVVGGGSSERRGEKRLIVLGGAGGARTLNQSMPEALARLRDHLHGWQVVHQTGEGQLQDTARHYVAAGVDALVVSYIDEMAPVMFASDLVVCRCAGTTLAELALAGTAALLVPYPPALDYQMPNAEVFASAGAAVIIDETELVAPLAVELVEQLEPLLVDDGRRHEMATRMRKLACPEAASNVTDAIEGILCSESIRLAA